MGKSKHFFGHPVYSQLIKSLYREKMIEAAMTAEVRKLHYLGIEKVPKHSTLSDANARWSEKFYEERSQQGQIFFGNLR